MSINKIELLPTLWNRVKGCKRVTRPSILCVTHQMNRKKRNCYVPGRPPTPVRSGPQATSQIDDVGWVLSNALDNLIVAVPITEYIIITINLIPAYFFIAFDAPHT